MLQRLDVRHIGPAESMTLDLGERMTFLVGDNGLGKSFLLDLAWFATTRRWARGPVVPEDPTRAEVLVSSTDGRDQRIDFSNEDMVLGDLVRSDVLAIYAHVDGGFSVRDPLRNRADPGSFVFSQRTLWDGNEYCEGLIRDWANWQREGSAAFRRLQRVLEVLSPSPEELLRPGELRRVTLDDPRRHPTLTTPYGRDVPLIHAAAGMKRIVSLAYLLVWTWEEHLEAQRMSGHAWAHRDVLLLVDEIESHLHPRWQRRIVPSLLEVMATLMEDEAVATQLVVSTHAPMVLASVEPTFDPDRDAIYELDLRDGHVELTQAPWTRRGDANAWLTSSAFDLGEARSVEAEDALRAARELLREAAPAADQVQEVDRKLRGTLGETDPFWMRWSYFVGNLASP